MVEALLQAQDVVKHFDGTPRALDGVSLDVHRGTTVALIGESGSGKSTLLRMFNRLEEPSLGVVRVDGRDVLDLDPIELRRHTGYMQQEGGLLPHWTVGRNVELVPELLGWDRARRRRRTEELLDLIGLEVDSFYGRLPQELSGGQRQRVAFARAIAADPEVILLDEPFGALDAMTRHELQLEFVRLKEQLGKTMVIVTHDLDEAFLLADVIAILRDGLILQRGTPDELAGAPEGSYVQQLLAHRRGAGV
jgi:osmoprotectant transport system ATP-binding protein